LIFLLALKNKVERVASQKCSALVERSMAVN